MADATLETQVLQDLEKQSIQARARPSPWDSSSAPGIGPGFGDTWFGGSLIMNTAQAADEIIQWGYYPMRRDKQLRTFWKSEGIMAGAIYSFSARISALPAKIEGPVRAKQKGQDLLHALDTQKLVIDMLTTDNGFFVERIGPGRADKPLNPKLVQHLAVMDSQQCWRTFDPEYPVIYINPYTGQYHKMHYTRVMAGSSCPQPDELARGIGFCAVSRSMRYAQIARDIEIFKHEKIGGRFTRAIGIMSGIAPKTMNETLAAHAEKQDSLGLTRYAQIPWFVSVNQEVKAQLVNLASLPDGYDAQKDTELYVNALALAFGTDVREFWPGQGSGATKADATVQHEKARGKGIADVTSTIERTLNWGVLDALGCSVEYDYTDDAEQMATAQYRFQVITNVSTMQQSGNISTKQGTAILIAEGVIDPDVLASVQDAEDSEPADTEAPYEPDTTPVEETAQPGQEQPPKLAKPPAAQNATTPTPPGGIKPPPAPTPRVQTSDMRPARKEVNFKYTPDQARDERGRFSSGSGSDIKENENYVARFTNDPRDDLARGWSGVMGQSWPDLSSVADDLLVNGTANLGSEDIEGKSDGELQSLLDKHGFDVRYDSRLNSYRLVHHEGLSVFPLDARNIKDAINEAKGKNLDWTGFGSRTHGNVKYVGPVPGIENLHIFTSEGTSAEKSRKSVKPPNIQHLHDRTNAYKDRLQGLMQDFFASGEPSDESDLDKRLADLKAGYRALSESGLSAAFGIGATHAATGHKAVGSALGNRKLTAVKKTSHDYFDGMINDLRTAVLAQMNGGTKAVGAKDFSDLASRFVNRIGQYAGHFWNSIWEGVGDMLRQSGDNQEVERHMDTESEHCSTCPDKEGVYDSWEDMANSVGVPGDGSDECGSQCKCYVTWGVNVS